MCTPQAALPKLKSQPQKLFASKNWISKYPASLIVDVIRKLLLVVNGPTRSGVRGQSVKSMAGLAEEKIVRKTIRSFAREAENSAFNSHIHQRGRVLCSRQYWPD